MAGVGHKPPLKLKEIWAIRITLQVAQRLRDLALFNLALDSKLGGCDLVRLRVVDVTLGGRVRSRAAVVQHEAGHPVQFDITEQTREALGALDSCTRVAQLQHRSPSRGGARRATTTSQGAAPSNALRSIQTSDVFSPAEIVSRHVSVWIANS